MHAYRSHNCGELRESDISKHVKLSGWVFRKRDFGKFVFIDLRDHYGITQLVCLKSDVLMALRLESVICIEGEVVQRSEANAQLATGQIEVVVKEFTVLSEAEILPFRLDEVGHAGEDLRLRYRFLDLRREKLHQNLLLRSAVIRRIREKMHALGFNEIQTPILTSSSPEGARDFVVPSRLYPGRFYALPQAPQIFKQLLVTSGIDRYFQIAPCFRDEDARADRSPGEFYQLDMEMAFATQEDVFEVNEQLFKDLFAEFAPGRVDVSKAFARIPYREAMLRYGSDKPDLRNPLEIVDASEAFCGSGFKVFSDAIASGSRVRAICVPDIAARPRRFFDDLTKFVQTHGAKGLAYVAWAEDKLKGPLAKFVDEALQTKLEQSCGFKPGSAVMFLCEKESVVASQAGALRSHLGTELELIDEGRFEFCWIVDFPMYERDEETGAVVFSHNPFSMPQGGIQALESQEPLDILAHQYDIVCNGVELSSGAVRNHTKEGLFKAFALAGYSQEAVEREFHGMVQAFSYGAPPHAGIAPGVDRIVMLLAGESNIREVVAFPMNQRAQDILMGAPCEIAPERLKELHLQTVLPEATPEV